MHVKLAEIIVQLANDPEVSLQQITINSFPNYGVMGISSGLAMSLILQAIQDTNNTHVLTTLMETPIPPKFKHKQFEDKYLLY